jgi:hypothetical protein
MSTSRVNGHPIATGKIPPGAPEPTPGGATRADAWTLDTLAERNACNERALAELRAAHDSLRRRYEAAVERLGALESGSAPPRRA